MLSYFHDRHEAGRQLARLVQEVSWHDDIVVLAIPRGGVPVAFEVASALGAPLDIMVVRKLGVPEFPELAFGAIGPAGTRVVDDRIVTQLGLSDSVIAEVADAEKQELDRRESVYRAGCKRLNLAHKTVVLVDDGLATGATMRAAAIAARRLGASRVIVAVPVGSPEAIEMLAQFADKVVCVLKPADLGSVGIWYENFPQLSDEDVIEYLTDASTLATRASVHTIGSRLL